MINLKRGLVIGVIVFVVVAVLFIANTRQERQKEQEETFHRALEGGRELSNKGDMRAIEKLEEAIGLAWNKESEVRTKLELGIAYQLKDSIKAVQILKEVVGEESYSDVARAFAANIILGIYVETANHDFAEKYIFTNEEPWRSFKEGVTMEEATLNAYEWSNNLSPSSNASYQIALWSGYIIVADELFSLNLLSPTEKPLYLNKFTNYFEQGNDLFAREIATYLLYPDRHATAFDVRGLLYAIDYVVNNNQASKQTAEASYATALKLLENNATKRARNIALGVKYHHAIFLSFLASRGENHKEAIERLVTAIVEEKDRTLPFFEALSQQKKNIVSLKYGALVAKSDPRFGDFLRDFGWEI